MNDSIRRFDDIALPLPEKEIFFRLGGHGKKSGMAEDFRASYEKYMRNAFSLCRASGRYRIVGIKKIEADGLILENDAFLPGKTFASSLGNASRLWCAASTVGNALTDARDRQTSTAARAVFDAVGSECADGAMDFLHRMAMRELLRENGGLSPRRYSPGYGDMPLSAQKLFFEFLHLEELGLTLSEKDFILPEKSVTAWAGVTILGEKQDDTHGI